MRAEWRCFLRRPWVVFAVLCVFVVLGAVHFRQSTGEDLASSYVGCRLVATGETGVLYSHDAENFADPGDLTATWARLAKAGGFHGYLHPYVQTPLWAYLLQPVCDHMRFWGFEQVFLWLTMLALAGVVWLVARFWTPWLFHAGAVAVVLGALWFSQPFEYAMYLMQTHALFFFLTIAGLILAERRKPVWGGALVACAAAVKLTPGILLLYWLLTRRWRAAASLVCTSVILLGLTYAAVGRELTLAYLADLHRVSRVLLVSQNNQSFAAWVMGRFYGPDEVFDVRILPLPTLVRVGSTALMVLFTVMGGWLDARRFGAARDGDRAPAPLGAMMALIALTVFAPIAWTHYTIILVAPLMVLVQEAHALRSWWVGLPIVAALILNYQPIATNVFTMDIADSSVVRGQFFSAVLCLATLGVLGCFDIRRHALLNQERAFETT